MNIHSVLSALTLILITLGAPPVRAQQKSSNEPALVINGLPIDAATRTINGRVYVDVEILSKALNLKLNRTAGVVVLESNTIPQTPQLTASPASVVGSLTYFFNRNYGNKPDTGAKVFLVDGNIDFYLQETDMLMLVGDDLTIIRSKTEKITHKVIFQTAADGNGRFEIKAIPPGKYTFIAISSHARGKTLSEIMGKVIKRQLDIQPGATLDSSHDFGMTYL